MIGEQFDHGDDICGAVVNVRTRQEKISLWTKNAANESAQVLCYKFERAAYFKICCSHLVFLDKTSIFGCYLST